MADRKPKASAPVPEPADALAALRVPGEPPAAPRDPVVQAAIDRVGEAGDAIPPSTGQTDRSTQGQIMANTDALADTDPAFESQYQSATERGLGYLVRRKTTAGKSGMIPPACTLHPKLGMWGLFYRGRWMIIRWIDIRPRNRQKRDEQGYQYFEGAEWCDRLGLVSSYHLNERNRVGYMDTELGWVPEEYVTQHMREVAEAQQDQRDVVHDRLMSQQSKYVPKIEIFEGDDDSVIGELRDRKRFAGTRS